MKAERYLQLVDTVASWSKDRSTKVGAVIVGPNDEVRSLGYNGFPRGVDDDVEERHERPVKYKWTEHAERNAIYNAARVGIPVGGCTMFIRWFPCTDCARAIIQSGITTLVACKPDFKDERWGEDFSVAFELLKEGNVKIIYTHELEK